MLFTSLVFLFLFLPITLLGALMIKPGLRKPLLLLASLVFYAWGGIPFVMVLIASILINYISGILIGRSATPSTRKTWYILGIILNILGLIFFKYTNFLVGNLNILVSVFHIDPVKINTIFLPLGISFFTFKGISYLVTINRKESSPQKNIIDLGLYLGFFPSLVAGPIDKYKSIEPQLVNHGPDLDLFASGVRRFTLGLARKVIIATALGETADQIFNNPLSMINTPIAWLGAVSYMLQIYYDFSAYTDMAIGLGRMFGFRFSENFDFPYTSRSIRDFWKRWHITLSTWLRDYLFLPVAYSTSRKLKKERYLGIRVDNLIYAVSIMLTFFICGLWHGAAFTYIIWGVMFGLLLLLERTKFGKKLDKGPALFGHIYTLFFILMAWVIFRAHDMTYAFKYYGLMFGFEHGSAPNSKFFNYLNREYILMLILAVAGCTRFFELLKKKTLSIISKENRAASKVVFHLYYILSLIMLLLILGYSQMTILSHTLKAFIYFRF